MNKLYFIIPVYKVEKYLDRCIKSVLNQTYGETEIVLVDDGSPDGCPKMCDEYEQQYKNVKVIHKKNGGLSDARNAGICYVREQGDGEDWLTFVDSDDFVHPEYGKRLIELCEKYDCALSQCDYEKGDKEAFGEMRGKCTDYAKSSDEALLGYELKSQSTPKMYKAKLFEDLLFPVGVINEDEFTTYKAVHKARRVAFTNERLYYYYQHGASIMDTVARKLKNNPRRYDFLTAYKERAEFFEKENKPDLVMKSYEKICTDIILRYCEQMYLEKEARDEDCVGGKYIKMYKEFYKKMIKRKGMPIKRKMMYNIFYLFPYSAVLMGKIFTLRK